MNKAQGAQLYHAWNLATRGVPLGTGFRANEAGSRQPRWGVFVHMLVQAGPIPEGVERSDYLERFNSKP